MRTLTISDPGLISGRRGYAAKVLSLGPIAYWPMEETSGTTMVASIGANGTYVNGPTLAVAGPSAKIPKAVSFDGSMYSRRSAGSTTVPPAILGHREVGFALVGVVPGLVAGPAP